MSLVSFMSESMSAEQSSLMFNPLSNIVRSIIADANGAMFDPSDMTTLYQDAAGTIPVTAVEQPVGKILDKSGKGNHATQSVTASRPTLSARYNLLTKTEDFNTWGSGSTSITPNTALAPNGTLTADLLFNIAPTNIYSTISGAGKAGITYTLVIHAKQQSSNTLIWGFESASFGAKKLSTLNFTTKQSTIPAGCSINIIQLNDEWLRLSLTCTAVSDGNIVVHLGSTGAYIWGGDLRAGSLIDQYQRVNTSTDYDTDERYFPKYLSFDGIDDYLSLPYMRLYGGGASSIVCARDAASQATDTYIISERSTTDVDPKYYPSRQLASGGNMDAYITDDAGTVVLDTTGSVFGGASNAVVRSVVDAGNNIKLFKNGEVAASDNYTRAGTLTLNTTAIGASVSTTKSNYAKMKLYGLLITKSALSDAQRIQCERLLARKAGVIL